MHSGKFSPNQVRKTIIEQANRAKAGHIGSALSIVEILTVLYQNILHIPDINDPERDCFILSKGHAALALYSVFYLMGWISTETLNSYGSDNTALGLHPEHSLPGVEFSTGSLGHGLSYGIGIALAAKLQQSPRQTYVLLSDAECNEGSIWEAAMFAAHHQLANLTVIIDDNKQQAMGYTQEVLSLQPLAARWRAFGWETHEVNGHQLAELAQAMNDNKTSAPRVIIAHTIFGKGVSFMEKQLEWHYVSMSNTQYQQAMSEITANESRLPESIL